ncbi:MAG TPA: carboxymuconolactone decarboxylase family protein [Thermoguttaceae bacterium]|nr:carboxymuconolactone decarboxylase family protein [Thermoguttaceae bacterium]
MPRLRPIDYESSEGKTKELLDRVESKMGMLPNIFRTLANSPAVLEGFVCLRESLEGGVLPEKLREEIALSVSQCDHSDYCLRGHTAIGKTVGCSNEEIMDARRGLSSDRKVRVALQFARTVVEKRGWVADEDLIRVREAGYNDEEITEMIGWMALCIFGDYFSQVTQPEVDFPAVPELVGA